MTQPTVDPADVTLPPTAQGDITWMFDAAVVASPLENIETEELRVNRLSLGCRVHRCGGLASPSGNGLS